MSEVRQSTPKVVLIIGRFGESEPITARQFRNGPTVAITLSEGTHRNSPPSRREVRSPGPAKSRPGDPERLVESKTIRRLFRAWTHQWALRRAYFFFALTALASTAFDLDALTGAALTAAAALRFSSIAA